jgi:hypothetical protein
MVYDQNRGHVQFFLRNGTFVRALRIENAGQDRTPIARLSNTSLLTQIAYISGGTLADSVAYRTTDAGGREVARLVAHRATARGVRLAAGSIGGFVYKQPFVAVVQSARGVVALPYHSYGGQPGQLKLLLVSRNGVRSPAVRPPSGPPSISSARTLIATAADVSV